MFRDPLGIIANSSTTEAFTSHCFQARPLCSLAILESRDMLLPGSNSSLISDNDASSQSEVRRQRLPMLAYAAVATGLNSTAGQLLGLSPIFEVVLPFSKSPPVPDAAQRSDLRQRRVDTGCTSSRPSLHELSKSSLNTSQGRKSGPSILDVRLISKTIPSSQARAL